MNKQKKNKKCLTCKKINKITYRTFGILLVNWQRIKHRVDKQSMCWKTADRWRSCEVEGALYCITPYLLQFLGNTHACVNPLSALRVLCLIVLQEVPSGELCADEVCERRIWNNTRATVCYHKGHCLRQQSQAQPMTQCAERRTAKWKRGKLLWMIKKWGFNSFVKPEYAK